MISIKKNYIINIISRTKYYKFDNRYLQCVQHYNYYINYIMRYRFNEIFGFRLAVTWSAERASTGWRFSWGSRRRVRQHRRRLPATVPRRPATISLPARPAPCVGSISSLPAPNACSTGPNSRSLSNHLRSPNSKCSTPTRCPSNRQLRSTPAPTRRRPPWPRLPTTPRTRTASTTQ